MLNYSSQHYSNHLRESPLATNAGLQQSRGMQGDECVARLARMGLPAWQWCVKEKIEES